MGFGAFYFQTVINPYKKGFLFPLKSCIANPVIISTLTKVNGIDQDDL